MPRIAEGVHRLGAGRVNAYLLEEGGEVTVIDAGAPGYWNLLDAELTAMGRTIEDVRAVVLTHAHQDHIGFAERMRRERHVPVEVHEDDAAMARGEAKASGQQSGPIKVGPLLSFLWLGIRTGMLRIPPIREVVTFGDGATLDVPGSPRVIAVPGHSPGSAALHVPSRDALFVGDAFATYAVTTGATGAQIAPYSSDPAQVLTSLDRLRDVEAGWVLPGHGEPWTAGMPAAVDGVRANAARTWKLPPAG
jgi:glyoxylase-like metal-dependent hydrolase (beta-lactamase superfamily II)